jgi:hypothetical protein
MRVCVCVCVSVGRGAVLDTQRPELTRDEREYHRELRAKAAQLEGTLQRRLQKARASSRGGWGRGTRPD